MSQQADNTPEAQPETAPVLTARESGSDVGATGTRRATAGEGTLNQREQARDYQLHYEFLKASDNPDLLGYFGSYEVIEVAGSGGMGLVFKAFDTALHRFIAIKMLPPGLAIGETARRRFAREGRAAAAINHEHVVVVHAVDELDGLPYLVMQYIFGESLQDRLNRAGPLPLAEIVRIGMQVSAGLAAAHDLGLMHRDIKPSNILIEDGVERVKITDFGLARAVDETGLTQSGVLAGTPEYMAPEQARSDPVDHRADLFSLGSVLYAMCTGRSPFRASGAMAVLRRVCEESPRPMKELNPGIPEWLIQVVSKLHQKNPADRFQSAGEVSGLLRRHLAHLQQPLLVPMPRGLSGDERPVKQSKLASMLCGATVALLGLATLVGWFLGQPVGQSWRRGYIPMSPSTAVAFMVLGAMLIGVVGSRRHWQKLAGLGAGLVILIMAVRLSEFAGAVDLIGDHWFFWVRSGTLGLAAPGRSSLSTAVAFIIGGTAVASLAASALVPNLRRPTADLAGGFGVCDAVVGLIFALGYLFSPSAPLLYGTSSIPMALSSALGFLLLGVGLIAAAGPGAFPLRRLSGPSTRARLLRVFLPLVAVTVAVVAWLTNVVIQSLGTAVAAIASAAMATLAILIFGVICERVAGLIGERIERAEAALKKAHDELEDRVAERTRELVQAKALLERRNRELQQTAMKTTAKQRES
jgi:hypothetical protein